MGGRMEYFWGIQTPKIIQLERREGICYSISKGNENRPTQNAVTPFLRWGIEFQSHSLSFAWSPCLASKSFGSWVQPAKFSSNVIESASAKLMLSHLQIPEMIGYKLLGLPFVIMKCKLVQSCMTTLHATLSCLEWIWLRSKHKAELDLGLLHFRT